MASKRKTYFLAPTRDCPPSGPIALGCIIASPHSPELPLTPPLPIDRTLMPVVDTYKDNWRLELEKHKSGKLGLWASFLQIVGVGGDVSVRYDLSDASVYQFKRLVTYTFWPNQEYVKESVMGPEVQAFLRKKRFH